MHFEKNYINILLINFRSEVKVFHGSSDYVSRRQTNSRTKTEETVFNDSTDYLTPRQTIPIPSESDYLTPRQTIPIPSESDYLTPRQTIPIPSMYITATASDATEPSSPRSFSQACYVNQQSTSVVKSSNNINVPPPCQPQSINEHEYHEIN